MAASAHRAVKTALIPVAGLGTRFLPATKAVPKELLPIVDKPTLQYIVEEAFDAGIEHVVFVNGRNKSAIEDHFDYSYELERTLLDRDKTDEVEKLRAIADRGQISSVRQKAPLGLGHAVLCGRPLIGDDEPFAVLLGDDIIRPEGSPPAIGQLMDAYAETGLGQIALMQVPEREISKYGAAEGRWDDDNDRRMHIARLVEKPPPGTAQTDQAIIGRYVLPGKIFPMLAETQAGRGGEIQLTDALDALVNDGGLMGVRFLGRRVDAGDKLGYLTANLREALDRPELRDGILDVMRGLLEEQE